jgi:hypothetical protein
MRTKKTVKKGNKVKKVKQQTVCPCSPCFCKSTKTAVVSVFTKIVNFFKNLF